MKQFSKRWLFLLTASFLIIFCGTLFIIRKSLQKRQIVEIDRAIVASDENSFYLDFWPIVAKAWKRLGIKPTLALIADDYVQVDEEVGDVIRFKPLPGIPTGFQAQVIRLLIPLYFEDEFCLLSDIDMIPISKSYFVDPLKSMSNNMFIVYRDKAYPDEMKQYPICYNAAKGSTFKEILGVRSITDIPAIINYWAHLKLGWCTDEILLYNYLQRWKGFKYRCIKLGATDRLCLGRRIDRANWNYDRNKLLNEDFYVDCHSLRPYSQYKEEIDKLAMLLDL